MTEMCAGVGPFDAYSPFSTSDICKVGYITHAIGSGYQVIPTGHGILLEECSFFATHIPVDLVSGSRVAS